LGLGTGLGTSPLSRRFILFSVATPDSATHRSSGTIGTLAGFPPSGSLAPLPPFLYALTWLGLLFLSFWAAGAAGKYCRVVDDGRIVIDELVGYLATVAFLPFPGRQLLPVFLFRFFDITKIPPARWFDRQLKNGYGVVLDDVVAGIYGAIALRVVFWAIGH
jgi:phosphatidylglycerophosphatase A